MKGHSGYHLIRSTLEEFIMLLLYSLMPIIIGTLAVYFVSDPQSLLLSLNQSISNGELLLWSLTITSGIAYSLVRNPPVTHRLGFFIVCIFLLLLATAYHSINLTQPEGVSVDPKFSQCVAALTMITLFFNIYLCKKDPPNTSAHYNNSASDFGERYLQSRERG